MSLKKKIVYIVYCLRKQVSSVFLYSVGLNQVRCNE
jgi:hypothetical protein